ncbi:MAG: YjbQ family protein [Sedimentisphaerales bacterium]|nr:YjbQ family protein [Sedimentisphaerales bacterium]MBN2841526.1 YjbQ family protein [Sedimentisphaerales bacterium]
MMTTIAIKTHKRCDMLNITEQVRQLVQASGVESGLAVIHVPHTTAAVTINENADPDVVHDILLTLEEMYPKDRKGYQHDEGNSDAHIKSSLLGATQTVIIENGDLVLGTWQGIFFCEFDGPRNRSCIVKIME